MSRGLCQELTSRSVFLRIPVAAVKGTLWSQNAFDIASDAESGSDMKVPSTDRRNEYGACVFHQPPLLLFPLKPVITHSLVRCAAQPCSHPDNTVFTFQQYRMMQRHQPIAQICCIFKCSSSPKTFFRMNSMQRWKAGIELHIVCPHSL